MWEIISATIMCLFAIFGFVAFIKTMIFKIYKPKNENSYLILNYKGNAEDIEYTLRSWEARIKWFGKTAPNRIFIVDNGLKQEEKEICRLFCKESCLFKLCTVEELYEILENDYIKL